MKKQKRFLPIMFVSVFLILIFGISYSIFDYSIVGSNNELITRDIYMHYDESNTLIIENTIPSHTYDSNKYFLFTVDGKNTTTNRDIIYDIVLTHGNAPDDNTKTIRILDKFLKFTLIQTKNGVDTTVVNGKSYGDLTNTTIWVDQIDRNTQTEVVHTYKLYMWIDDSIKVGNEADANHYLTTFINITFVNSGDLYGND